MDVTFRSCPVTTSVLSAVTSHMLTVLLYTCSHMRTSFEEDFPSIQEKKQSRKNLKKRELDALTNAADLMSARTYKIMMSALEDLVSSRRGLLAAFRIWRAAVGAYNSHDSVSHLISGVNLSSESHDNDESETASIHARYHVCVTRCTCPVAYLFADRIM